MPTPTKYESTTEPGLFFWVEPVECTRLRVIQSHMVLQQVAGFPATEAFDDWFCNPDDADAVARKLAKGEL